MEPATAQQQPYAGICCAAAMISQQTISAPLRRIALIVVSATLLLAACGERQDPESRLRQTVAELRQGIESKSADQVLEHVADDLRGQGGMDRDALRRLLVLHFLRNQSIGVTLGPMQLQVQVPRAEIRVQAILTGAEGWLPQRAGGYAVVSKWRLQDDQWLLEYIDWQ